MAFDLGKAWRVAEAVLGIADAGRRVLGPSPSQPRGNNGDIVAGSGVLGHIETRLTNVLVSALKEAFDHDAARIDLERTALEEQRRRAEEALRLELVRQAGDRALARARLVGGLAVVVWIVSTLCLVWAPGSFGALGRALLAAGWAGLAGSVACALAANTAIDRWLARTRTASTLGPEDVPEGGPLAAAPWLLLAGLVLVGASLLI